jgi:hypothetical protein
MTREWIDGKFECHTTNKWDKDAEEWVQTREPHWHLSNVAYEVCNAPPKGNNYVPGKVYESIPEQTAPEVTPEQKTPDEGEKPEPEGDS